MQTIRKGDWKLIPTKKPQLYNLKTDLAESKNLAGEYPEKVKMLKEELAQEIKRF